MSPRVTVVLPTYNWSAVLPFSIGSVLRQTFGDFELLVVGDGCTDDSERVVHAIGDPRVQWINLPENTRHQSGPNNEALRRARGEFIAYLGHDDLWLPHHLAAHVEALEKGDVAYSLCMLVPPDGASLWPSVPRPELGMFSPPSGMTHRRSVTETIGGWRDPHALDEKSEWSPDVELWRRAQSAGCTFAFVPRLTAIKFPAAWRRDVYRERPSHEQQQWLARIDAEPDLEAELLVRAVIDPHLPSALSYRDLLRHVARQTLARVRRRFSFRGRRTWMENRRYKGLPQ